MDDAKKQMVEISHILYRNGMAPGKSGNISSKISVKGKKLVLITPSGVSLKNITPDNVVVVDIDMNQLQGLGKPSSELMMHLEIYRKREDVRAVVHTHSPYATGFSFSDEKISRLEGFGKIENPYLKIVEYSPPGSAQLAASASQGLEKEDVLILKNHGVLAVGADLEEASLLAEFIEYSAKTSFVTHLLSRGQTPTHLKHSR